MYSMSVSTTRTHIHMHHINSIHTCSMLVSNTHASHQQPSLLLICFCYQQLQTNPPSTPAFLYSHSHTTTHFLQFTGYYWFFFTWLCILFTWRSLQKQTNRAQGAWHFRLEEAQKLSSHTCPISIRKELRKGLANMPRQGIDKRSQAGNWQSVPGRDCKTCPGRALADVPREGNGKRSQAGKWQAFPGR